MVSEDRVEDVYKLVKTWCRKNNCYTEERVQDYTWRAWCKIQTSYDESRSKLSTYVYVLCDGFRHMDARKKYVNTVSLDTVSYEDGKPVTLHDKVASDMKSPLTEVVEGEDKSLIRKLYDNCSNELKEWLNGKNQDDIARALNVSQPTMSRRIKNELNEIKAMLEKAGDKRGR